MKVGGELSMAIVMVAFDRRLLDRPVHPCNLAIGPWMLDFREPVLDLVFVADPVEDMMESVFMARLIGELDAIIGQHGVD